MEDQRDNWAEDLNEELYKYEELCIDPGQSSIRIDKFLSEKLEKTSRNRIQQAIIAGNINVNGQSVKSNYKVRPGDKIAVVLPTHPDNVPNLSPEAIPLEIVYEDEDLLVINKQPGLVVHPGVGNNSGTLVNALLYHFQYHKLPVLKGNPVERPGLVHRIDKDTSGLMVIAKSEYAMTHLARQFYEHSIERTYWALVWGDVIQNSGTINAHIGRHEKDRMQMQAYPDGSVGKEAITHYEVLERMYYVTLVKCRLETGRTHQIRAHMKFIGHTLFNDARYGGDKILKGTIHQKYKLFVDKCFGLLPRQALHAKTLGFIHPVTQKFLQFDSPLPDDFRIATEEWRNYIAQRNSNTL